MVNANVGNDSNADENDAMVEMFLMLLTVKMLPMAEMILMMKMILTMKMMPMI